jgi:hypothetical protein
VRIDWELGDAPDRFHDAGAQGDRRDEVAVHDVEVDAVRAAALGRAHGLAERGEVGAENAGGDLNATAFGRAARID